MSCCLLCLDCVTYTRLISFVLMVVVVVVFVFVSIVTCVCFICLCNVCCSNANVDERSRILMFDICVVSDVMREKQVLDTAVVRGMGGNIERVESGRVY